MAGPAFRSGAATLVGRRREHNEDSHLADGELGLFIVADGMGGHACGEVASALAVDAVRRTVLAQRAAFEAFTGDEDHVPALLRVLEGAVLDACREIHGKAQEDETRRGMGTTCSVLVIAGGHGLVAHVGDSRVHLVRSERAVQLTRDHTLLGELIQDGELPASAADDSRFTEYSNTLARAVGVSPSVEVDTLAFEVLPGDALLLGSDGLFHYVDPGEIPLAARGDPQMLADKFAELANDRGGHDNITAVVVQMEGGPSAPTGEDPAAEFQRRVEIFGRVPLFHGLPYRSLLRVLAAAKVHEFEPGQVLVEEGLAGDALYVILSGRVRVEAGGRHLVDLTTGAHLGELSLIDRAPRSATATVVQPSKILRLRRRALQGLMERAPDVAVKLLWNLSAVLAERLRTTTARLLSAEGGAPSQSMGNLDPEDETGEVGVP